MKRRRRTLQDVRREIIKSRLVDFVVWRRALASFWRFRVVWTALKFRWANRRRRNVLAVFVEKSMSPDWRDSRPKKLQRKLGILPPIT